MTHIEEKLWDYIDGNCAAEEQKNITALIASDAAWQAKYQELLNLNKEFSAMELEEPSMAFTYNVMETIRDEAAKVPLKSVINKRIIWGIGIFFAFTILALLVYIITNTKFSGTDTSFSLPQGLKMPDLKNYFTKPVIECFFFFDVILALFLSDAFFRKKRLLRQQ